VRLVTAGRRLRTSGVLLFATVVALLGAQVLVASAAVRGKAPARAKIVGRACPKPKGHRPAPKKSSRRPACRTPATRKPVKKTLTQARRQPAAPTKTSAPLVAQPVTPTAPATSVFTTPTPSAPPTTDPSAPTTQPSAWDEPTLNNATVITLSPTNYNLALPQNKDYILQCLGGPIYLPWTLSIWGGHNVVIQHCDFEVNNNWVAYLHNTAGTLWVNDVHFGGTNLTGGVQLQEPGATVVMRDVLFDTVYGTSNTNHAELIQTWSGPARFLIDGLTGSTTYQGLFLLPNQWDNTTVETQWDFRNLDIDDTQGAYALYVSDQNGAFPLNLHNVYVEPNPVRTWRGWWLWGFGGQDSNTAGEGTWASVIAGTPPDGHYVQAAWNGATGVDDGRSVAALTGEEP
jgi:hypothetical protein